MVWNISISQLGCLSGCAPSQLLHICSLAEYEKLEKVIFFITTTENISAIDICLILNPKHNSYWGENYPSRNQDTFNSKKKKNWLLLEVVVKMK